MARNLWTQFRAQYDDQDISSGVEARIHDPLWLLTRQWQMGEFQGEDAGSPVRVTVEHDAFKIDRMQIDDQPEQAYDPRQGPLEMLVEQETAQQVVPDLRTRSQHGLLLWEQLRQANLPFNQVAMRDRFGFDAGLETPELDLAAQLLIRKAPDAQQLYPRLNTTPLSDSDLVDIFGPDQLTQPNRYRLIAQTWVQTYEATIGQPNQPDAWREDRLEYHFSLSVPTDQGRVTLQAEEYAGGRLDWDSFDVPTVSAPSAEDPAVEPIRSQQALLPTPVTYLGMPAPRFWEFEKGAVDFGNPEATDRDLGRLLLAEFVMSWGNDWFQVPLEVPTGSLCRINQLRVTDTFGVTTQILSQTQHSGYWGLNYLRQRRNKHIVNLRNFLFVPPALPKAHQAVPIEEVLFRRDEMANLTWAIEKTVADAMGRPQALVDQAVTPSSPLTPFRTNHQLEYQAMTNLPDYWIPLVPTKALEGDHRFFMRAGLLDELQAEAPEPVGELLSQRDRFQVHEEEIPYEGVQVDRAYQLTRWYDGRRALWVGRRKRSGQGEVRSHLEFDTLTDKA
ncbi:MAG: hypothetical protein AAGC54_02485 [Cyanobacteria bacterium P01_F01_bin.4]